MREESAARSVDDGGERLEQSGRLVCCRYPREQHREGEAPRDGTAVAIPVNSIGKGKHLKAAAAAMEVESELPAGTDQAVGAEAEFTRAAVG